MPKRSRKSMTNNNKTKSAKKSKTKAKVTVPSKKSKTKAKVTVPSKKDFDMSVEREFYCLPLRKKIKTKDYKLLKMKKGNSYRLEGKHMEGKKLYKVSKIVGALA